MVDTADDVVAGIVCMQCHTYLIGKNGELNSGDFPCYCQSCWRELPAEQRREGAPYFDEATGEVLTGEQP